MANELDVIGFNTTTPTTPFGGRGSTRGITQLREASQQLSQLLGEKIQALQVDQAIKQGQEDAMSGKQPKTLAPSGLNAVTNAYNQSVLKRTGEMFEQDYSAAKEGLDESLATGNTENARQYGQALDNMIDWYGERHPDIRMAAKGLKKQLAEDVLIGKYVGGYAQLGADTSAANTYLADFVSNPPTDLTVAQQQKAAKKMWDIRNTQSHLQSQAQAEQLARYENAMAQGVYPTTDAIMADPVLSDIQKIRLDTEVKKTEAKAMAAQLKVVQAQKSILAGNAGAVSKSTINDMFDTSVAAVEAATGKTPSMMEMAMGISGDSPAAVSGIPGQSVDTNVPHFDAIVSSNISSGDAARQAEAVEAYRYLVKQKGQPNLINLSGQEANFAETAANLLSAGDIESKEVMDKLNKSIYQTSDADRKVRRDRFNKDIARTLPKKFKDAFGVKPGEAGNDLAEGYFNNLFSTNYMISGDVDSAFETTKYMMRGWGKSQYAPNKGVVFAPPEQMLPESQQLLHLLPNQIKYRTQELVDSNFDARKQGLTNTVIEWSEQPETHYDLTVLGDDELSLIPMRLRHAGDTLNATIKVDGHESKVYLVPGADVLNNAAGNPVYHMYYQDRYGNFNPLPNPSNPSGIAKMELMPLSEWAPSVFEKERDKQLRDNFVKGRRKALEGLLEAQGLPGIFSGATAKFLETASDAEDLEDIYLETRKIIDATRKIESEKDKED